MTVSNDNTEIPKRYDDVIQPFIVDSTNLHGRFVRLTDTINTILSRHDYPFVVSVLLGELLTITALLSRVLKHKGILTVQIQGGDGDVPLLVADVTAEGELRGYADVKPEARDALTRKRKPMPLTKLVGKGGYIVMTLDRGKNSAPYQGIVEIKGNSLTECCLEYLHQSEQFTVHIKTSVTRCKIHSDTPKWRSAGIMLQRLPDEEGEQPILLPRPVKSQPAHKADANEPAASGAEVTTISESPQQAWERSTLFIETLTNDEMLDPQMNPHEVLFRLFYEDGVWVYESEELSVGCRCNRERIETMLNGMSKDDLDHMAIKGKITVTCQFCNKDEVFKRGELGAKE